MPRWSTIAGAYIRERLESTGTTSPANTTDLTVFERGLITMFVEDGSSAGTIGYAKCLNDLATAVARTGASVATCGANAPASGCVGALAETLTADDEFAKLVMYGYMSNCHVIGDAVVTTDAGDLLFAVSGQEEFETIVAPAVQTDHAVAMYLGAQIGIGGATGQRAVWFL